MEEEADGHQREWGPNNVAVKTLACHICSERSWVQISSWNIRSAGRRAFLFSGFLSTPTRFSPPSANYLEAPAKSSFL